MAPFASWSPRPTDGTKKLGFVYPEGPVLPRPERDIVEAGKKRVRPEPEVRRAKARKLKEGDAGPEDDEDLEPLDGDDGEEAVVDEAQDEHAKSGSSVPNFPLKN